MDSDASGTIDFQEFLRPSAMKMNTNSLAGGIRRAVSVRVCCCRTGSGSSGSWRGSAGWTCARWTRPALCSIWAETQVNAFKIQ